MAETFDTQTIRAYLLGRLTGPERQAIADRLFEDDDLFAAAREVEDDLIDALARGELPEAEAIEVRRFLDESSQMGRLKFAEAMAHANRKTVRGPVVVRTLVAIAAMLIVAMVGVFYYYQGQRVAIQKQLAQAPGEPVVFAFFAPAGTARGAAGSINRIKIPPGVDLVKVSIDLESGYQSYSAVMFAPGGREVSRTTTKEFSVPAPQLSRGRYEIEVKGARSGALPEPLGYCYFEIE